MDAKQVRTTFLDFFKSKQHGIVPSAPMVIKNDPTLMFTNAGMNQFKDIFLGNSTAKNTRIADTQKCLRVSGKHNDLDEVGHDTYHHTMFEMLGNWSFGDYFKKEAIEWAWELLTVVYGINKDNLYITVFGGDKEENLAIDKESLDYWKKIVPEEKILFGNKKDNFWEMGDTGPCGPCSEIHIDLRSEKEKNKVSGRDLVNRSNPLVIEIWNLVFIEFNRKTDGSLEPLPARHVDTGMGFERLCMVLQEKTSNYDTDVFRPIIKKISQISGSEYGKNNEEDIAMRVVADHLRAVAFAIADGQLPSNNKAGYVIRRILRRAVRYGYTFLDLREPFIFNLVPVLVHEMGNTFTELVSQQELITRVIQEEEQAFLRTLATGIGKFDQYISAKKSQKIIDGKFAFELFDTFGFPIDLTQLMANEKSWTVDMESFQSCMKEQKNRSKQAAEVDLADWVEVKSSSDETIFVGYETHECEATILKYRKIKTKEKEYYQLVLDQTPFYAESGGQVGDKGMLVSDKEKIFIEDTRKENNLTVHITSKLPVKLTDKFHALVDLKKRIATACNHSATHLLHAALKEVLGKHVEQKGSLVDDERLRFDFTHFSKMTDEEIGMVENIVNAKIRANIQLKEHKHIPIEDARKMGAVALFGEKYGEFVRVISFDPSFSIELCGGIHISSTGQIGIFKFISESAIAAGIRRIEAITAFKAEQWIQENISVVNKLHEVLKGSKDLLKNAENIIQQNENLQKQVSELLQEKARSLKTEMIKEAVEINEISLVTKKLALDAQTLKNLAFEIRNSGTNVICILANIFEGKPGLTVAISEGLTEQKKLDASAIVRELAKEIHGSGGGQKFYATAGGKDAAGLDAALKKSVELIRDLTS
jgi:alanyl-tRNA synthetase